MLYILRYLLFLFGVILALPILAIIALSLGVPVTISGVGYLFGWALVSAGLILVPWAGKNSISIIIIGVAAVALVASVRLILIWQEQDSNIRMVMLPQNTNTRWINTLLDEQDSLIVGEALFNLIGGDSPKEHEGIAPALQADYSEMRATQRVFPSPFVSTYLGLETPSHFDVVVIEPEINRPPSFALIFLHGYMGNVAAQCWEIAQAVKSFGAITVCPSTGWQGEWWLPQGKAMLRTTFEWLREQGIEKFYLGGFSNGGFSISCLAPGVKNEKGLSGLILIDGIDNGAGLKEMQLPILILQGAQDERVPAAYTRQIAEEIGELGTYVEVEGDHFLIMKQPGLVQNAMASWLKEQKAEK